MAEIRTQHLFHIQLAAGQPQMVGPVPGGERRVVQVLSGTFTGERLSGSVLPGGTDWIMARGDGALELNVRLVLQTTDNALIGMTYRGLRHGPAEVLAKVNRGEPVDPASYYFRTAIVLETGAKQYDWLNRIIAIGTGYRTAEGPCYDVFEVL